MKQWYQSLFENYAHSYDKETYVQNTIEEIDFMESEFNFDKSIKILDIGCGTGRHAIELAKRGYKIIGVDLSEDQLALAREKAAAAGVEVTFLKKDARNLEFNSEFDAVIMMCEGAFPLMETDEMNFQILQNAAQALVPGGIFIFTTLNGLFPLFHSVKDFINTHGNEASAISNSFDLMTFRDHSIFESVDDSGNKRTFQANERYYVPSEITWLLKSLQFSQINIFGEKKKPFGRGQALSTEDFEMLVIARKQA